jgi:acyl-CoA thioester hydrolase
MSDSVPETEEDWELVPGKLVSESTFLIRESHLDVFGHVNNASYLKLFEEARWDLLNAKDYGLAVIRELRRGPVVLEARVKFRREVLAREQIVVRTYVLPYDGLIGRLRQRLYGGQGKLACEAHFQIALWDIDARRLVPPTPRYWAVLGLDGEPPAA